MNNTKHMKLPFLNLVHVGIVVYNMKKTITKLEAFQIGPAKSLSLPPSERDFLFRGKVLCSRQDVFVVPCGSIDLELFEPLEGDSPWSEFLEKKGEGIHHFAYSSDDIERDMSVVSSLGISVIHNGKWEGGGFAYLDLGASNIIIEIIQL